MDERIREGFRRIYAELVPLILLIAAGSLLIKFLVLEKGPEECATEFLILVFCPVYMTVRQNMMGLPAETGRGKKKRALRLICAAGPACLVYVISAYGRSHTPGADALVFLITFVLGFVIVDLAASEINRRFVDRKSRKYEDD